MTTGDGNRVFVDTNVLVYATIPTTPLHQQARQALQQQTAAGRTVWISRQILREYIATLTRPQTFTAPLPPLEVIARIRLLQELFPIAEDEAAVTSYLLTLLRQIPMGGRQIYDANLVATMRQYQITHLLTHNVRDFVRFQHLITIIPL